MAIKISKNRVDMGSTPIKNVSYLDVDQVATQAAPATGKTRFYSKTDGSLYVVPAAGSETAVGAGVAANVVAYFNGAVASIPAGWTEFTAGRGRTIVGVPLSGTVGGTVGTALTDVQNKTHTHTGPSHGHNQNSGTVDAGGGTLTPVWAVGVSNNEMYTSTIAGTSARMHTGVVAAGTGATGTAATGDVMAYIQQPAIVKS